MMANFRIRCDVNPQRCKDAADSDTKQRVNSRKIKDTYRWFPMSRNVEWERSSLTSSLLAWCKPCQPDAVNHLLSPTLIISPFLSQEHSIMGLSVFQIPYTVTLS